MKGREAGGGWPRRLPGCTRAGTCWFSTCVCRALGLRSHPLPALPVCHGITTTGNILEMRFYGLLLYLPRMFSLPTSGWCMQMCVC